MHSIADSLKILKKLNFSNERSSPLAKPIHNIYNFCFVEMGEFWFAEILQKHLYNRVQSLATS